MGWAQLWCGCGGAQALVDPPNPHFLPPSDCPAQDQGNRAAGEAAGAQTRSGSRGLAAQQVRLPPALPDECNPRQRRPPAGQGTNQRPPSPPAARLRRTGARGALSIPQLPPYSAAAPAAPPSVGLTQAERGGFYFGILPQTCPFHPGGARPAWGAVAHGAR